MPPYRVVARGSRQWVVGIALDSINQEETHWFDADRSQAEWFAHPQFVTKGFTWLKGVAEQSEFTLPKVLKVNAEIEGGYGTNGPNSGLLILVFVFTLSAPIRTACLRMVEVELAALGGMASRFQLGFGDEGRP